MGQERLKRWSEAVVTGGPDARGTADVIRARLADDIDAPAALEAVDAWSASSSRRVAGSGELLAHVIESSLGVSL